MGGRGGRASRAGRAGRNSRKSAELVAAELAIDQGERELQELMHSLDANLGFSEGVGRVLNIHTFVKFDEFLME